MRVTAGRFFASVTARACIALSSSCEPADQRGAAGVPGSRGTASGGGDRSTTAIPSRNRYAPREDLLNRLRERERRVFLEKAAGALRPLLDAAMPRIENYGFCLRGGWRAGRQNGRAGARRRGRDTRSPSRD